mgnify:CR=1 FL=1
MQHSRGCAFCLGSSKVSKPSPPPPPCWGLLSRLPYVWHPLPCRKWCARHLCVCRHRIYIVVYTCMTGVKTPLSFELLITCWQAHPDGETATAKACAAHGALMVKTALDSHALLADARAVLASSSFFFFFFFSIRMLGYPTFPLYR